MNIGTRQILRTARHSKQPPGKRLIFGLPDIGQLSPFPNSNGSKIQTYHGRIILPYRRKELYEIVADVNSYPQFIPYCTGSRIIGSVTQKDDSLCMDAELTVGFLSLKESYVSEVTCTPYEMVEAVASSSTPLFKTLTTTWRFQPASPQSSHPRPAVVVDRETEANTLHRDSQDHRPSLVTLDLAYAFENPLHAAVSSAFFGRVSEEMLKAFETRCIEVYGPKK